MDWELIGRLLICCIIVAIPIVFSIANVNYTPQRHKARATNKKNT